MSTTGSTLMYNMRTSLSIVALGAKVISRWFEPSDLDVYTSLSSSLRMGYLLDQSMSQPLEAKDAMFVHTVQAKCKTVVIRIAAIILNEGF